MTEGGYQPMTDEELNEVLAAALEVDVHFTESGSINKPARCGYCGQLISPDPTDEESWVHVLTGDAQCVVDGVRLDGWAEPDKEDRP